MSSAMHENAHLLRQLEEETLVTVLLRRKRREGYAEKNSVSFVARSACDCCRCSGDVNESRHVRPSLAASLQTNPYEAAMH
jgi:hypothetical protein